MRTFLITAVLALAACEGKIAGVNHPNTAEGGSGGAPCADADDDGATDRKCGGTDCNDHDATIAPGKPELCDDGIDQDCDGGADETCFCGLGDIHRCWTGEASNRGVGACTDGFQRCSNTGEWGACEAEVATASDVACDGEDSDCDGAEPACPACAAGATELCDNGFDDDCNGVIDDPEVCSVSCDPGVPRPDIAACCLATEPLRHAFTCTRGPGPPLCNESACLDLDGSKDTKCESSCDAGVCTCGRRIPSGDLERVPDCGFETACEHLACSDGERRACYTGATTWLGNGPCRAGLAECEGGRWGPCEGEVLPGTEDCDNDVDDDCDGRIDEKVGRGTETCWPRRCLIQENCGNGLDDDCDGWPDGDCPATDASQRCYGGPKETRGVGSCHDGLQHQEGEFWGPCNDEQQPAAEVCGDRIDSNCDGRGGPGQREDAGCCIATGPEACNGLDDDCDGIVDDGVADRCGGCNGCRQQVRLTDLASCDVEGRTCRRIAPADGDGITLEIGDVGTPSHALYVEASGNLVRIDTQTGKVDWAVAYLPYEGGLAVALDDSFWTLEYVEGSQLGVRHRGADGSETCSTIIERPSAVEVDPDGTAWVLARTRVDAYLPNREDDGSCRLRVSLPIQNSDSFSIALGPRRVLWVPGPVPQLISASSFEVTPLETGFDAARGVSDGAFVYFEGSPGARREIEPPYRTRDLSDVRDLSLAPDGTLWGLAGGFLVRDLEADPHPTFPVEPGVRLLAVNGDGFPWLASGDGTLERYDPSAGSFQTYPDVGRVNPGRTEHGSATNTSLRRIASLEGTWSQLLDGLTPRTIWRTLSWAEELPPGAAVEIFVRAGNDPAALAAKTPCKVGPPPITDLARCVDFSARYLLVDVWMFRTPDGEAPVVRDIKAGLSHN